MCQLGAVLVSEQRVYRQDGARSHSRLHELATTKFPDEKFMEAEYDFENRRWGYGGNEDDTLRLLGADRTRLLRTFSLEQWPDADALMRFCEHAGVPGVNSLLLTVPAMKVYDDAVAATDKVYNEVAAAARKVYDEAMAAMAATDKVYNEVTAVTAAMKVYLKTVAAADKVYDETCYFAWLNLFSDPANRIPIWREVC